MKINFEVNHKNIKDVPETSIRFCVQSFISELGAEMISEYLLTYLLRRRTYGLINGHRGSMIQLCCSKNRIY